MGSVETFDGAGQPDESPETLDVTAAIMHQLVFSYRAATAGKREQEATVSPGPHHSISNKADVLPKIVRII